MKHKRGDIRADGKVFWEYTKKTKSGEYWITAEKYEAKMQIEREKQQRWRDRNPDASRQLVANHAAKKGPEFKSAKQRRYYQSHRSEFRERIQHRKAMKMKLTPKEACRKTMRVIYDQAKRLSDCLGIKFHVDHVKPLAIGGIHHPGNLQAMPWNLNLSKGATHHEFRWAEVGCGERI